VTRVPVGFALQPDLAFLDVCGELLRADVDYYEVTPETTWRDDGDRLIPNGFHRAFLDLAAETGRWFVAHGVGLSLGGPGRRDLARRRRWLRRIADDQALFRYRWYTDHLGMSSRDGENVALPLPLAMTAPEARRVRARLAALARIVPLVGVENTAQYFVHGDPLDEPEFLNAVVSGPRSHLLLDLHNVHVMAENLGFDALDYLERLDLRRVVEIHLAGGRESDPRWLPSGRTLLLDSHDAPVPDAVWDLYEWVLPRCPNLRGVTLERMEGTVTESDVPLLREELRRARAPRRLRPTPGPSPARAPITRQDGERVAELLVAKLRFERLIRGSREAEAWFEGEPRSFVAAFHAYHRSVAPTAFFPAAEARLFDAWANRRSRGRIPRRGAAPNRVAERTRDRADHQASLRRRHRPGRDRSPRLGQ
jgi:uncharacterized protein